MSDLLLLDNVLEKLAQMESKINKQFDKSESVANLALSLSKAQSQLTSVAKDTQGYGYKYATLDSTIETLRKPLADNGLSYMQMPSMTNDGRVQVTTLVMHESGEFISSTCEAPADTGKQMNAIQGVGSAITYLRRYSLASVFGVPFGDDSDGVNRSNNSQNQSSSRQYPPPPTNQGGVKMATEQQIKYLHVLLSQVYGDEKQAKKETTLKAYKVESTTELTMDQIKKWIDALKDKQKSEPNF